MYLNAMFYMLNILCSYMNLINKRCKHKYVKINKSQM